MREVRKLKLRLEQFKHKAAQDEDEAQANMAPLVERQRLLVSELSGLFNAVCAAGRLSGRAQKQVAKLRRTLEARGLLSPIADLADEAREPRRGESVKPEVASAQKPAQGLRSLREIFRNLARAVHPDRAGHDEERARRTELMKEVTRAYEDGDLARLIELESTWQSQQALVNVGDSEARCQELERVNRELLDQVRAVTRELRDIKRDARDDAFGLSPDELAAQAARELDGLDALCELLRRFRDGKISLVDLVQGTLLVL